MPINIQVLVANSWRQ